MVNATMPTRFWPLLWGGVALALCVVLVLEYRFGAAPVGREARLPAKVAEAKLIPPLQLPPEAQAGTETTSRPLFAPSRRPSPPAAPAGASSIKRGQFLLQGTTIVGPLQIAMLKEISSGTIHRVQKGEQVLGMTLEEVAPEQVVLRSGEESEVVPLIVAKAGGAAASPERGPFAPAVSPPPPVPPPAPAQAGVSMPGLNLQAQPAPSPPNVAGDPAAAAAAERAAVIARRRAARAAQGQ
jgi:hypothetical protein